MSDPRERTLSALHTLRELDEARAQANCTRAERSVKRRRDTAQRHESALRCHQQQTLAVLSRRETHEDAATLQQRELYRRGRAHTEAQLRAALRKARRALQEAEAQLSGARAQLGSSHAQRRAVERERDRQVQRQVDRRTRG